MSLKEQLDYLENKTIENPINSLEKKADEVRFPTSFEPSLSHPYHHSIVKLRDNGIIDIFVGDHQGFRIDPNTETIDTCTNNLLQHLGCLRSWISRDAKVEIAGGYHLVNHAAITVDCKGGITVNTNGNITVNASGSVTVNAGGEIKLASKKHIQFSAPRYDFA